MFGRRQRELEDRLTKLEKRVKGPRDPLYSPHAHAGTNVRVDPDVVLRAGPDTPIHLEDNVKVYRGSELTGPLHVGEGVFLNRGAYVQGQVTIGSNTSIGQHVRIITDTHELGPHEGRAGTQIAQPVAIGVGVWMGACVTVLPGVTIGDGAVVAAGAVVTQDVAPDTLVGGVPARPLRPLS